MVYNAEYVRLMSKRIIAKFSVFVIFIGLGISCNNEKSGPKFDEANSPYGAPQVVGRIESDEIRESSGLAASFCQYDVLWTHNDSGDGPYVYAVNRQGKTLGVWKVAGAKNEDWEDIDSYRSPSGECYLYIGEIGNTDKLERPQQTIYRVKEPTIEKDGNNLSKDNAAGTEQAEKFDYQYVDGKKDAETLLVRPENGDIYVLTKMRSSPSGVYRVSANFGSTEVTAATKIADLSVPAVPNGFLTGGGVSPDGKRVILCDYSAAYELVVSDANDFDSIWKQQPVAVSLGTRKQGEAITYSSDGQAIFATSEGRNGPVIEVDRKK